MLGKGLVEFAVKLAGRVVADVQQGLRMGRATPNHRHHSQRRTGNRRFEPEPGLPHRSRLCLSRDTAPIRIEDRSINHRRIKTGAVLHPNQHAGVGLADHRVTDRLKPAGIHHNPPITQRPHVGALGQHISGNLNGLIHGRSSFCPDWAVCLSIVAGTVPVYAIISTELIVYGKRIITLCLIVI